MDKYSELKHKLKEGIVGIDSFIEKNLQGRVKKLWDAANHYIKAGGKRLRPFMVRKSFELFYEKSEIQKIIPVAAAIELLHTFTLIHDDIMDNDDKRRNVTAVHRKWDNSTAILAGDLLFAEVFVFLHACDISSEAKAKISKILGQVSADLCEGQMMDMDFETRSDVSIEEYLTMIELKTGALFKASCEIGAISAGAMKDQIEKISQYAINLGKAFQIVDDILGITADEDKLGKPIGSDLREGKKPYIILPTLASLNERDAARFQELLDISNKTPKQYEETIKLIEKTNALEKARDLAQGYITKALEILQTLPHNTANDLLGQIAEFSLERAY